MSTKEPPTSELYAQLQFFSHSSSNVSLLLLSNKEIIKHYVLETYKLKMEIENDVILVTRILPSALKCS